MTVLQMLLQKHASKQLKKACLLLLIFIITSCQAGLAPPYYGNDRPNLEYELPPLEFGYDDLEPYIDEATVRVHYHGHHAKYTDNMNNALKQWRLVDKMATRVSVVGILRNLNKVPEEFREVLKKNTGGYFNHNIYWSVLSANKGDDTRLPRGQLAIDITAKWNSIIDFKKTFIQAGNSLFGSGYVFLCRKYNNDRKTSELVIVSTSNQDSPLGDGLYPILTLDVWEHAYYLKHKNLRAKYINDWWKIIDWTKVENLDKWWQGMTFHDEL